MNVSPTIDNQVAVLDSQNNNTSSGSDNGGNNTDNGGNTGGSNTGGCNSGNGNGNEGCDPGNSAPQNKGGDETKVNRNSNYNPGGNNV